MSNRDKREVRLSTHFERSASQLRKHYRNITRDLAPLLKQLEMGETPGDRVQGSRHTIYKTRVANSDANRGKSGGYRVLYYVYTDAAILLLTVYSKSEQENISVHELDRIIENN